MFIVLMGVSGCGKTTVGKALAERLHVPFYDADNYHAQENLAKMATGISLTDKDRTGWLTLLASLIETETSAGHSGVLACSALKQAYRDVLRSRSQNVRFVYLKGSYELILGRMLERGGHFMKPRMLKSQFEILEEPADAITVKVSLPVDVIVKEILLYL
jgi:gluconokinase